MDLDKLAQYVKEATDLNESVSIPPLDKWQPQRKHEIDLTIKANGEWWYEGNKMTRQPLVNLFATVLWAESLESTEKNKQTYFLKTPVEQAQITVEDVPLFVNNVSIIDKEGVQWLEFTTTTGDAFLLNDNHQPFFAEYEGQTKPYIYVRNGLNALIMRSVFYHLIELGDLTEKSDQTILTLESGGNSYRLAM